MNQNTNLPAAGNDKPNAPSRVPALASITRATEALTHTGQGVEASFDAPRRIGATSAFLVFGVFGIWAVFAPLGEYAHAAGRLSVSSYNKVIQHLEGGIVKELQVRNGDTVKAGDVLAVAAERHGDPRARPVRALLEPLELEPRRLRARDARGRRLEVRRVRSHRHPALPSHVRAHEFPLPS